MARKEVKVDETDDLVVFGNIELWNKKNWEIIDVYITKYKSLVKLVNIYS